MIRVFIYNSFPRRCMVAAHTPKQAGLLIGVARNERAILSALHSIDADSDEAKLAMAAPKSVFEHRERVGWRLIAIAPPKRGQ